MKRLRLTVSVDPERAPPFFELLANSQSIAETRLLEWNEARPEHATMLYAVDGDPTEFERSAPDTPGVESVTLSEPADGWTYALLEARPRETPVFATVHEARARGGIVVRKPVVFRDSTMFCRVFGESAAIQATVEGVPDAMDVRVDEIATLRGDHGRPTAELSARQRAAVAAAVELGYYEHPRRATHADVADHLDCAAGTAGEHLRRAEAKLVTGALDSFGTGS
jgi:predicted DNA binding protein